MYHDRLEHDREETPPELNITNSRSGSTSLNISSVTVIEFEVNNKDPIKKIYKGAGFSSYHIPSAIFAVELSQAIEKEYPDKRIGIISPYRMQVDIMYALAKALNLNRTTVSTVHGFQGDERDVIIFVLNPPSKDPTKNSHFYNRKLRNVAISRARDYLIILKPNIERDKDDLFKYIIQNNPKIVNLEDSKEIFDNLYNDIEIYQHLNVNVYPMRSSFVKNYSFFIGDNAIDIQIKTDESKDTI